MANYRVKVRQFCAGRVYEVGDICDESVAAALGASDVELVDGEGSVPARATKPLSKAKLKKLEKEEAEAAAGAGDEKSSS